MNKPPLIPGGDHSYNCGEACARIFTGDHYGNIGIKKSILGAAGLATLNMGYRGCRSYRITQ